jgi:hypothetical protein
MKTTRAEKPFWRRRIPRKKRDITLLRPPSFNKSKRFETLADSNAESLRSEAILKSADRASLPQQYLCECRAGDYHCEKSYCPRCGREFRRWFIGEVLRLVDQCHRNAQIVTVLLARSRNIEDLKPTERRHLLRQRMDRAGLANAQCVGGFEMIYRARERYWVLHINLLIFGGTKMGLGRFAATFSSPEFVRPTQSVPLNDLPKQISYLLKFTTYHRPQRQIGSKRSPAKPLNAREHAVLVNWMSQYGFADMMFLYGVRRQGDRLVTSRRLRG